MTWFPVPRYVEHDPGLCHGCGPTHIRLQYAGPGIWGLICCRCGRCIRVIQPDQMSWVR